MLVRSLEFDSAEYWDARELRLRLLREPLGLPLSAEDTAGEAVQHHFGLLDDGDRLIGCVVGKPDPYDPSGVRIRQMAIAETHRGQGNGRRLLLSAEAALFERGFRTSTLYARAEAAPFYERCGYRLTGETTQLIGLPHLRMQKRLAASAEAGDG